MHFSYSLSDSASESLNLQVLGSRCSGGFGLWSNQHDLGSGSAILEVILLKVGLVLRWEIEIKDFGLMSLIMVTFDSWQAGPGWVRILPCLLATFSTRFSYTALLLRASLHPQSPFLVLGLCLIFS